MTHRRESNVERLAGYRLAAVHAYAFAAAGILAALVIGGTIRGVIYTLTPDATATEETTE
jgi:hypothetical protein